MSSVDLNLVFLLFIYYLVTGSQWDILHGVDIEPELLERASLIIWFINNRSTNEH